MRRSLFSSFSHAWHGFARVFHEERNIRIHACAALCALLLAWLLHFSSLEIVLVILMSGVVIASELLNAALERYSDIVKPRVSGYVAEIKDIAAAGVLVLSVTAVLVGIVLYVPKVLALAHIFFTGY